MPDQLLHLTDTLTLLVTIDHLPHQPQTLFQEPIQGGINRVTWKVYKGKQEEYDEWEEQCVPFPLSTEDYIIELLNKKP